MAKEKGKAPAKTLQRKWARRNGYSNGHDKAKATAKAENTRLKGYGSGERLQEAIV